SSPHVTVCSNDTPPPGVDTLSLHDALPIYGWHIDGLRGLVQAPGAAATARPGGPLGQPRRRQCPYGYGLPSGQRQAAAHAAGCPAVELGLSVARAVVHGGVRRARRL